MKRWMQLRNEERVNYVLPISVKCITQFTLSFLGHYIFNSILSSRIHVKLVHGHCMKRKSRHSKNRESKPCIIRAFSSYFVFCGLLHLDILKASLTIRTYIWRYISWTFTHWEALHSKLSTLSNIKYLD